MKTFLLTIMMAPMLLCAQLINGDFESWTDNTPDGWTIIDSGIELSPETTTVNEGSTSASFNVTTPTQGDTDFRQVVTVVAGNTYNISFKAYHTEGGMRTRLYVGDYLDYTDPELTGTWQQLSYTYLAPTSGDVEVGLRFYDVPAFDGEEIVYIDDFVMEEEVITGPSIVITSPEEGAEILTESTSVSVVVQNFTIGAADGYFTHSLDGGTAEDHFDTDPFTISGLTNGAHTLTVELVESNGTVVAGSETSVNFTVAIPVTTTVSNIAELRAGNQGDVYELTGEAILTYQQSFRNQKYIQDATAGILIDDNDGNVTSTYEVNDGITGIVGTLGEFGDMLQFVPIGDPGAASSSGNSFDIPTVTLSDLVNNFEDHEAEVVRVLGMSFNDSGVALENGTVYPISDASGPYNLRTTFFDVDYIGSLTSDFEMDVQGIPNSRIDGEYFTPRNFADFLASGIEEINPFNISLYPNPNNGVFILRNGEINLDAQISLIDITGRIVFQENRQLAAGGIFNFDSKLSNAGIYTLQVLDNNSGRTSTHSIVIQ